jgi:hypothetical protein
MATVKLFNILAISSLAILACSFWCTPVNALSIDSHHVARHNARAHDAIAVKKRSNSTKRCKHRPSSSSSTTTTAAPYTPAAAKGVAADPTTSSSSTTTTTPYAASTPSSGKGKMGVAWPNGDDPSLTHYKTAQTQYIYTWSPEKPAKSDSLGFTFMPMLWCDRQIGDFTRLVVEGYAHHVLGPNEPNEVGQCNIDASHGAYLWRTYIDPLHDKGYTTFSPAMSSRPNGVQWMKDFFKACQGCKVDVQALHWYNLGVQEFKDYLTQYHDTFGLDIAVTEFAAHNFNNNTQYNADEIKSFMTEVLQWGHETSWIHSLFPFGFMHDLQGVNPLDSLMKSDGTPTALGELAINGGY